MRVFKSLTGLQKGALFTRGLPGFARSSSW